MGVFCRALAKTNDWWQFLNNDVSLFETGTYSAQYHWTFGNRTKLLIFIPPVAPIISRDLLTLRLLKVGLTGYKLQLHIEAIWNYWFLGIHKCFYVLMKCIKYKKYRRVLLQIWPGKQWARRFHWWASLLIQGAPRRAGDNSAYVYAGSLHPDYVDLPR